MYIYVHTINTDIHRYIFQNKNDLIKCQKKNIFYTALKLQHNSREDAVNNESLFINNKMYNLPYLKFIPETKHYRALFKYTQSKPITFRHNIK